ncbi:MFS transporter [Rossellomorea aquimaris]|uniref:MFS transporter n=1 Tax=Rossellomorea aquimaris TaxID=189382 RepID=UPI001CD21413|nr:MFS transporter [Rossellomorea aquimaris]MCA1055926.1 MFS transporter [Rossellomorea aquimaris]
MRWKKPLLLLLGIGLSNVGAWIFLIALNLIVLDETGSALAVGILYVLKPLAALFTNGWAGSVIDRLNKRGLMVFLDVTRAGLVAALPFCPSITLMYAVVFVINMGSAVFYPTSMTYMTKLIPSENRQRFNALRSLIGSGAFLIGPAVAGLLFIMGTPTMALYLNAIALFLSGMITLLLPDLEGDSMTGSKKFSFEVIKKDLGLVRDFSRRFTYVMVVYLLFSCMLVMTAAIDSLEAAFSKEVLGLSNSTYGYLVSIAGGGFLVGALVNIAIADRVRALHLIAFGSIMVSAGYVVYSFSDSFITAAIGFSLLSFSLAFAQTGFETFIQERIPVEVMGRVSSIYGWLEGLLVIVATVVLAVGAELLSIRTVVTIGAVVMLLVTVSLCVYSLSRVRVKALASR